MNTSTRSLAVVFSLAFAALGCGDSSHVDPDASVTPDASVDPGTPPATTAEFITRFAGVVCEKIRECDSWWSAYTQEECTMALEADLRADLAPGGDAIRLDPNAATSCLALLAELPACDVMGASNDLCLEDGGAFVGTVPAGGACDSDARYLCAPGTVCSAEPFSGACGACVARPLAEVGEPCETTANCRQSATTLAYCDLDPVDARDECVAWTTWGTAALGESCEDEACPPGAQCDWNGTVTCVPLLAVGAECDPNGGADCNGLCVEDGASSLGGICRAFGVARAVGDACGLVDETFVECSIATHLACDPVTSRCIAPKEAALDESCADDISCAAGLRCDGITDTCVALAADGEPCNSRRDCLSGFCFGPDGASVCGDAASVEAACTP